MGRAGLDRSRSAAAFSKSRFAAAAFICSWRLRTYASSSACVRNRGSGHDDGGSHVVALVYARHDFVDLLTIDCGVMPCSTL